MKRISTMLLLMALLGCKEESLHESPPPGYTIVCDGNGNFAARHSSGHVMEVFAKKSRQEAIERAWQYEEWLKIEESQPKPPPIQWHACD